MTLLFFYLGLFAELLWRDARLFFEKGTEIVRIIVAALGGHLGTFQVCRAQKLFGVIDAQATEIVSKRFSYHLAEYCAEMIGA
jgi:hypothetical protein